MRLCVGSTACRSRLERSCRIGHVRAEGLGGVSQSVNRQFASIERTCHDGLNTSLDHPPWSVLHTPRYHIRCCPHPTIKEYCYHDQSWKWPKNTTGWLVFSFDVSAVAVGFPKDYDIWKISKKSNMQKVCDKWTTTSRRSQRTTICDGRVWSDLIICTVSICAKLTCS